MRSKVSNKFEAQAGLNVNKTRFELDHVFPLEATSSEQYSYGVIWCPQFSLLYKPAVLQTIYASASRGFSLPSVEETLTANGSVNSSIKPESGYNLEVGGKFYLAGKTLFIELAAYRMQIKDLLVAQRIADDQYVGVNAGETLHEGIEISGRDIWQVNAGLSVKTYFAVSFGRYEFLEFNDRDNDFSGNKLSGVPANKINAGITLTTALGLYLSADFRYVDTIPLNDANSVYADAYRLLDLKSGYLFEIFPGVESALCFGVNNVGNEHYASMILPNATAFGSALPRYYYPGMPLNYYGNISIVYTF
jgi:iron complex outermembrane receptor protein